MAPDGTLVMVGAPKGRWILGTMVKIVASGLLSRLMGRKLLSHLTDTRNEDLVTLKRLIESGAVTPVIDRLYPLSEVPDAIRYLETMRARGKVIITL